MPQSETRALRDWLTDTSGSGRQFLQGLEGGVSLASLAEGRSSLGDRLAELAGRSVLIATRDQLTTALSLLELDGVAQRLTLCPPDVHFEHLPYVVAGAAVDAIVTDCRASDYHGLGAACFVAGRELTHTRPAQSERRQTEWILLTSGTTGGPKMVRHSLASLTAAIKGGKRDGPPIVWSTFYDIRRYGGLQIFLRAILGGTSLVLSSAKETTEYQLARFAAHAVTHVTGTPSHWRRVLMSETPNAISPRYVRLSGEIAGKAILDNLRACYPGATIAHAYASTEAGVAFEVEDGSEGFPASWVGRPNGGVMMKIKDGSLRIRSNGLAAQYVGAGAGAAPLVDEDGFVDTGDILERRGDRYYFVGRRGGIINVGGLKVHPEEVEAVINLHPKVKMSLVLAKKNPITGSIVVADVVLSEGIEEASQQIWDLRREILKLCRDRLAEHKIPAAIRFVPALAVAATGKVARRNA